MLLVPAGLGFFLAAVLGILVSSYPSYVESRFQEMLEKLGIADRAKVVSSTCLGVESDRIRIFPILCSKVLNRNPHPAAAGRMLSYEHGQRFNYRKVIDYGRHDVLVRLWAYWSVCENRWHAGGVVTDGTRFIWQCVPGVCPLKEHTGKSADEYLAAYEPTLGSLFSDFNSAGNDGSESDR